MLPLVLAVIFGVLVASVLWIFAVHSPAPPSVATRPPRTIAASPKAHLPVLAATRLPIPVPPPPPAPVVYRITTDQPVIFVTIDDGVFRSAEAHDYIIQNKIPISAFLTTDYIARDPGYFATLQRTTGMAIGNHTINHPHMIGHTYTDQKAQICASSDQLQQWYGTRPAMFRPPYGEYDTRTKQAAAACGIKWVVLWNVVLDHGVMSYQKPDGLAAGDIVLLHFRSDLKRDLETLSKAAQERGLHIAPLQDYLR